MKGVLRRWLPRSQSWARWLPEPNPSAPPGSCRRWGTSLQSPPSSRSSCRWRPRTHCRRPCAQSPARSIQISVGYTASPRRHLHRNLLVDGGRNTLSAALCTITCRYPFKIQGDILQFPLLTQRFCRRRLHTDCWRPCARSPTGTIQFSMGYHSVGHRATILTKSQARKPCVQNHLHQPCKVQWDIMQSRSQNFELGSLVHNHLQEPFKVEEDITQGWTGLMNLPGASLGRDQQRRSMPGPTAGKVHKVLARRATCQGSPGAACGHAGGQQGIPLGLCRGCPALMTCSHDNEISSLEASCTNDCTSPECVPTKYCRNTRRLTLAFVPNNLHPGERIALSILCTCNNRTMRFASTAKVLAKVSPKYYRISQ